MAMSRLVKSLKKLTVLFVFPLYLAGLFIACDNDFLNDGVSSMVGPKGGDSAPVIWNTNTLYINPFKLSDPDTSNNNSQVGTISGSITAVLNEQKIVTGGLWFSKALNNSRSKQWDFSVDAGVTAMTAGSLTAGSLMSFIAGDPIVTDQQDQLTLSFTKANGGIIINDDNIDSYSKGNVCTLQLYPDAFYGPARDTYDFRVTKLDFTISLPTKTFYSKYLVEKTEYTPISVSWMEGSASAVAGYTDGAEWTDSDIINGMKFLAGSLAGVSATASLVTNTVALSNYTFEGMESGEGSFSVNSWGPEPDITRGWLPYTKYALTLNSYAEATEYTTNDEKPVNPVISVPITFTSDVGSIAILIKEAERFGSFSALQLPTDTVSSVLTTLVGDKASALEATPLAAGENQVPIVIKQGTDGSPADGIEVTAVYLAAPEGGGGVAP
jgi:hypothetical protein